MPILLDPTKLSMTVEYKETHSMSKPNLQIQIYRRSEKENFKLKKLIIPKKKGVNPRQAIKRGKPHTITTK